MHRFLQIILLVVCLATMAVAEVPHTISYQGRLTDNGIPVNGLKSVTFTIYDGSGTPIWNSGITHITFSDGLFTVELGQSPQTPLPLEMWPADTAMSLGVTIETNPELSPRLHFKTVPYAMHAMTAESAGSGGGWLHGESVIHLENSDDYVGLGTNNPAAKLEIVQPNNKTALLVNSSSTSIVAPAMILNSTTTGAVFRTGGSLNLPGLPRPAIFCSTDQDSTSAAWFFGEESDWPTVIVNSLGSGSAIQAYGGRFALDAWSSFGIYSLADSGSAIVAQSNRSDGVASVISSVYTGSYLNDHVAVSGYSRPGDFYGVGGRFEGGFQGICAQVNPTGDNTYYGVISSVLGGGGTNYGVAGSATGNGTNLGIYGYAQGGAQSWAGYFSGDVSVTGNIVKSASTLAIDSPTDPENEYLQQAEVVSDNLKAVYDGNVTLGSDGSAVVQLPDYLESFCGDFRYQLTCVGGYAPVYVSSEISGNQFVIAGGKDGLKVSWQITGIRKDKYAQSNPLEVEKKKTATEQGRYLHPELYGYSADRSLSPNPDRDPSMKAKNDAIRTASEALKKPITPTKQPVMMEKK
jgi:hypothetical protein